MKTQLKELAFKSGFSLTPCGIWESEDTDIERFAELVRRDDREAWAKHIESVDDPLAQLLANAIRARGEK